MITETRLNEMGFTRRFNLGNYEHEEITVKVAAGEEEDPSELLKSVMAFVNSKGDISLSAKPKAKVETQATTTAAPAKEKKEKKAAKETATESPKEATEKAEVPAEVVAKVEAAEPKKLKAAKGVTQYDRSLDFHKKLISEFLDVKYPTWRQNPQKAKDTSIAMEGKDFLDGEGMKLKSFMEEFDVLMKSK